MDKYTSQLLKLQPPGRALPSHQSSNWVRLLAGIAQEFSRIDVRLDDFTEAFLLQSGEELLSDWERVLGLPEQCLKSENITDIAIRRARVKAKLADNGPQDKAYFIKLAADLGITATVIEFKPFFMGSGQMGDALGGYENVLAWQMDFQTPISAAHFAMVKCLVRHNKPAETQVIFSIDGIPEDITAGYNYHEMRVETWAGELETLPADRLVLDGSLLDRKFYPSLFRWLGHQYAAPGDDLEGDTFRLPDLRGYTLLGTTSDEEVGQFQEDKLKGHSHSLVVGEPSGFLNTSFQSLAYRSSTSNSGVARTESAVHAVYMRPENYPQNAKLETRMKNISVYFMVKMRPYFYTNTIGMIAFVPTKQLPKKSLRCDGHVVSRLEFSELFDVIGTTYGAGDGTTTFTLPNIDDVYIRGTAHGSIKDPDRDNREDRGDGVTGDAVGTRQAASTLQHAHRIEFRHIGKAPGTKGYIKGRNAGRGDIATWSVGGEHDFWDEETSADYGDKNYMRSVKMQAVIFYEA